jgi:hypothetical protein
MKNRNILRAAGSWIEVAEVVMQGVIVVYLRERDHDRRGGAPNHASAGHNDRL